MLFVCIAYNNPSSAQTHKYLIINGLILSELDSPDSCALMLTKNNSKSSKVSFTVNGRFRLELDYNSEYQLAFQKKGHQTKTLIVNTDVPGKILSDSRNLPHFLMALKLYSDEQNLENHNSENHLQYVSYSPISNSFGKVSTTLNVEYVDEQTSQKDFTSRQLNKLTGQNYQVF